jgi:hypothetical protein
MWPYFWTIMLLPAKAFKQIVICWANLSLNMIERSIKHDQNVGRTVTHMAITYHVYAHLLHGGSKSKKNWTWIIILPYYSFKGKSVILFFSVSLMHSALQTKKKMASAIIIGRLILVLIRVQLLPSQLLDKSWTDQ